MIESYKSPLRITCLSCRGEGRKPFEYAEQYPDLTETICDGCGGLGYTVDFVDVSNPLSVQN